MKIKKYFLSILLALSPIVSTFGGKVICVTDMKNIVSTAEEIDIEISNSFWIPTGISITNISNAIKKDMEEISPDAKTDEFGISLAEFDADIRKYHIYYSGIVKDKKKAILFQLYQIHGSNEDVEKDRFGSIWDGSKPVITAVYDPKSKLIEECWWHYIY